MEGFFEFCRVKFDEKFREFPESFYNGKSSILIVFRKLFSKYQASPLNLLFSGTSNGEVRK
jgi:hypothetical protein